MAAPLPDHLRFCYRHGYEFVAMHGCPHCNGLFGTVSTNEEHQEDFEGEEPTQDAREHFDREWSEARHVEDQERIKGLQQEVAVLKCSNAMLSISNAALKLSHGALKLQLERVLKEKQPTLRSERRVLVDVQDE
jgi:uncharacterized Zn finger protein (UPF0148 family)